MQPTADTGQAASTDDAGWAALAGQAGRPGIVVEELFGIRRNLFCFDPDRPIITSRTPEALGFGGWPYSIQFADGQVVVTNNLAHVGEIPARFHEAFPPTAVVSPLPSGDTYELSYADAAGHNLRRVTTTSPQRSLTIASRMSGTGDQVDVTHIQGNGTREPVASFAGGKALPQHRARGAVQGAAALHAAPARAAAELEFPVPVSGALSYQQLKAIAAGPAGLPARAGRGAAARNRGAAGPGPRLGR